jgi:DNA polymerase-3 subunit gamma/tau
VEIDEAALHAIARGADGGMRDAQSTLDQLISFCGTRVVEADVLSMFGLASRAQLLSLAEAILNGDAMGALRLFDELARGGKDLGRLLGDLLAHFRNLLLLELSGGDRSLLEVSEAEWMALQSQSKQVDPAALGRVLEVLSTAETRLREAPSKRIFLEVTVLTALEARSAVSLEAVLRQLKALRDGSGAASTPVSTPTARPPAAVVAPAVSAAPVPAPSPSPSPSPVPKPAPAPAPAAAPPTAPAVAASAPQPTPEASGPMSAADEATAESVWNRLYSSLEKGERMLWTMLAGSVPRSLVRSVLTVACPPDVIELASTGPSAVLLKARLREILPGDPSLKFVPGENLTPIVDLAPAASAPAPSVARPSASASRAPEAKPAKVEPQKLNKDEFLADPLIQEAMAVFRAQLVDVRAGGA